MILASAMIAASGVGMYAYPVVRPVSPVIEIRSAWVDPDMPRGWRFVEPPSSVAGEAAPDLIYVRVFDGIFAINPFERLPDPTTATMRQVFGEFSLQTERRIFGRARIEATEELFRRLEEARISWLRQHGYVDRVRTFTNERSVDDGAGAGIPEPRGWFRVPDDMPRGRSREQVRAEAPGAGLMLARDGDPLRISWPLGTPADVMARSGRNFERVATRRSSD